MGGTKGTRGRAGTVVGKKQAARTLRGAKNRIAAVRRRMGLRRGRTP